MKKNILLVLLSAALLAGCEFDVTLQKFFGSKKSEEETIQKEEENNENSQENQGNSGENGNQNNNQNQPPEIDDSGYTATLVTSGSGFSSTFSAGSHFDTAQKQAQLLDYLSSQLEYTGLIEGLSCTNLHTQEFDDVTYMQFGSQKGVGALGITSGLKIYKVEVKVLCFAKYDSYHNITNIDSSAHFFINDQDNDMSYDGSSNPSVMSFEKSFDEGVDIVTFASKDGRVFLKEMTITWKK